MIALLQRVAEARVRIDGRIAGEIGPGLLLLVCAERGDSEAQADKLLAKLLKLRIFSEAALPEAGVAVPMAGGTPDAPAAAGAARSGKMNHSLQDVAGGLLIVSQFTLAADTRGGNRPSFSQAAPPDEGRRLYDYLVTRARAAHPTVATGEFGADMRIELINDGPVTIPLRVPPGD